MKAVVVAGGEPDPTDVAHVADADLVIAADGGGAWLDAVGIRPAALVGDLDSIDRGLADRLAADGVKVERHPAAKDATDAELALDRALAAGVGQVILLGALAGRRLDHALGNLLLLARRPRDGATADVRLVRGGTLVRAVRGGERLTLEAAVGGAVSLIPLTAEADGVRTSGLHYPLHGEALELGTTRGVSNVVVGRPASVSIERGVLLVVEVTEGADQ